jgi:murein DD-endopeptidase MepM/ murein hydrolase activator NlpD
MKKFLLILVTLLLVLAIPLNAMATDNDGKLAHKVKAGQNISIIAARYDVDVELLAAMNNLDPSATPQQGTTIWIPQEPQQTITVTAGDSLWQLAQKYNTTINTIVQQNAISNPNYLKIGQKLVLPANTSAEYQQIIHNVVTASRSQPWTPSLLFSWPLQGEITSCFGNRESGFHHGLDIAAEKGTEIAAAQAGTIIEAGWLSGIYGRGIVIDHSDGYKTLYAHVQDIEASVGDHVQTGDVIATIGMTGLTTGPHLHLEIRINDKAVDPLNYLP